MSVHVAVIGSGPRVVLVHGAMTSAEQTWAKQMPLAERWTLVLPTRRGYAPNPFEDTSDFEVDAADLGPLLDPPTHLVGHSYGSMSAMLAASQHPDRIRSLTVIEPPAFALARGDEGVEAQIADHHRRLSAIQDPREFMIAFLGAIGAPGEVPDPLPPPMERMVRTFMGERPPWEMDIPIAALRDAPFPTLVATGGHNPTLELLADLLVERISARREVITGRGHVVQRTGEPFNALLEDFLLAAER